MTMNTKRTLQMAAAACTLLASTSAMGRDSMAPTPLGGLTLSPSAAVEVESEDLFVSENRIKARYVFANTTSQGEELLVNVLLPIPTAQQNDASVSSGMYPNWDEFDFKYLVDGKPAELEREDVPLVKGKSVAARLKSLGWPVLHWKDTGLDARLNALDDATASRLVAEGLLIDDANSGGGAVRNLRPGWIVETRLNRSQFFPSGDTVTLELSYKPSTDGAVDTSLHRENRAKAMAGPDGLAAQFCVDQDFVAAYDRRIYNGGAKANPDMTVVQSWFRYNLTQSPVNDDPVKKFRLVVDKGNPGNFVSFCLNGARKINDTQFEIVKTDFKPARDLDVFLVEFIFDGEGR